MIEVILLERIERLGSMGDVVKVKPGFARNFLLPKKKALRATKSNLEVFEKQRADLEAQNAEARKGAEATAKKMEKLSVVIIRQASEMGMLFGSVTSRDIAAAAKEQGFDVTRYMVQIDTPIKTLGLFAVKIKLHPEVTTEITVNVARSADEAKTQAEKEVMDAKKAAEEAKAAAEKAAVEAIGTEEKSEESKVEEASEEVKEEEAK